MRKVLLYLLFLFTIINVSKAQTLTQSADGKSSIPLPLNGMGLSVDIGKTEVALGINNYEKVLGGKTNTLVGLNLTTKHAEGIGNLFSTGDLVPSGNFLGFLGKSFSNNSSLLSIFNTGFSTLQSMEVKSIDSVANIVYSRQRILGLIDSLSVIISDSALREKIKTELTDTIKNIDTTKISMAIVDRIIQEYKPDTISIICKPDPEIDCFKMKLQWFIQKFTKAYRTEVADLRKKYFSAVDNFIAAYRKIAIPRRLTVFLQGGISARSFTRYLALNDTALPKSFQDTLYRGGLFGIGINLQVKNYWIGVTYTYIDGDNFIALKNKEYTLKTTNENNNQQLVTEKKYNAYSGKYSKVQTNELNIDIVGDYKLSDTSRLLANLYLRGSLFSRDTSYIKNYINLGAGLYFLGKKGKFIGGLYVELPDINNNIEKAKPADEINIRPPFKKLTFGIVTKFNLSSIFAFANRPAKPD